MIGVLFDAVGKTQADYDAVAKQLAVRRKLHKSGWVAPGIIAHVAGPIENGWRVIDVWETEEAFRHFSDEFLRPAFKDGGVVEARPHIFQVYNFVKF
ncbi:MAG TPA: hypothetical protein VK512_24215 [Xanthobacteraceae bacterium]|nr:hypothetical protein [Xanthobacteraceae bacterium]